MTTARLKSIMMLQRLWDEREYEWYYLNNINNDELTALYEKEFFI